MNTRARRLQGLAWLLLLSNLVTACATRPMALGPDALKGRYRAAVADAAVAEPSEIAKTLVAIVPSNNRLVWKNASDPLNARILVATWTSYAGYDDKIGAPVTLSREVWVTTVPEVKDFSRKLTGDKTLRLEQLLGLPPNNGKTKFVEMWARPADLFRPSADPEITDGEAEVDFRAPNAFIRVSDEFKKWYDDLKAQSYGASGYPWTRLGYTYDWGAARGHVGASEFVIIPGSTVEIHSVTPTAAYGSP